MSKAQSETIKDLVKRLSSVHGEAAPDPSSAFRSSDDDPNVVELVYSMLLWEADRDAAAAAFDAFRDTLTGLNELRVCDTDEIASMMPRDTPKRTERASRLVAVLNAVFEREHSLSLSTLNDISKREARQYLDGLEGMPPFVAARVVLIALGGHAIPADDRIMGVLEKHGVIEDLTMGHGELVAQLERIVRAPDARQTYAMLEAEACSTPSSKAPRAKKKSGSRSRKTKAES